MLAQTLVMGTLALESLKLGLDRPHPQVESLGCKAVVEVCGHNDERIELDMIRDTCQVKKGRPSSNWLLLDAELPDHTGTTNIGIQYALNNDIQTGGKGVQD